MTFYSWYATRFSQSLSLFHLLSLSLCLYLYLGHCPPSMAVCTHVSASVCLSLFATLYIYIFVPMSVYVCVCMAVSVALLLISQYRPYVPFPLPLSIMYVSTFRISYFFVSKCAFVMSLSLLLSFCF